MVHVITQCLETFTKSHSFGYCYVMNRDTSYLISKNNCMKQTVHRIMLDSYSRNDLHFSFQSHINLQISLFITVRIEVQYVMIASSFG